MSRDRDKQNQDFPHAILHVDGDSFFVSCELTRRPDLRGRAVVTGEERGIATAMNPAAKALGVTRGMRVRDIRRFHPSVVILPSDYRLYALYARRMYGIVRRWAGEARVEEYSIDECFADLTDCAATRGVGPGIGTGGRPAMSYEAIARAIQADLHRFLGITFSAGLAVNKVTAKIASKWQKPAGLTVIRHGDIRKYLVELPVGKIWGIGGATTMKLRRLGVTTALDLATKDRAWVSEHCDRPLAEIYEEFQGHFVKELSTGTSAGGFSGGLMGDHGRDFVSVQRTRTFHPSSRDPAFLWSQISYHTEDACQRLRAHGRLASRASLFLKTQDFQYLRAEAELPDASAAPADVLHAIRPKFDELLRRAHHSLSFRAAGISLGGLEMEGAGTGQLFEVPLQNRRPQIVHRTIDRLTRRFGREAVFLGSSMRAMKGSGRNRQNRRESAGSFGKKAFDVIYLGEVS